MGVWEPHYYSFSNLDYQTGKKINSLTLRARCGSYSNYYGGWWENCMLVKTLGSTIITNIMLVIMLVITLVLVVTLVIRLVMSS